MMTLAIRQTSEISHLQRNTEGFLNGTISTMAAPAQHPARAKKQGLYKVTIHAYRREGMSEEDFHHHWTNIHAPKVCEHLRKFGVIGYTQYHTPSWTRSEAAEKLKTLGDFASSNVADFDGYVELRMPDLSCYERAREGEISTMSKALVEVLLTISMTDPYYKEVVEPDEAEFFDLGRSRITVGWEEVYIDDRTGKIAEDVALSQS